MDAIRIGTAGWSYKDWEGIVYPARLKQHPAEYLARYFDVIEINTSFYGPIKPALGKLWSGKVAGVNPDFKFTAKLYRRSRTRPAARCSRRRLQRSRRPRKMSTR